MVRFSRYTPPVEFKPGSARAAKLTQSPQRGQALFLIQDKPATIFTIAKTGAMLFVGQICSRETTALAVEPSCGSDSKSRATLRSSTSLGKTLQACRETQGEFPGHTITPLGVTGAFYERRFPLCSKTFLSSWRKRRACHALHIQAHVAIAAPARGTATPIHSLNYACSGSGRVTASTGATVRSTSPLPRASHCALALTDFHEVSRAVGPNWQGRKTRLSH